MNPTQLSKIWTAVGLASAYITTNLILHTQIGQLTGGKGDTPIPLNIFSFLSWEEAFLAGMVTLPVLSLLTSYACLEFIRKSDGDAELLERFPAPFGMDVQQPREPFTVFFKWVFLLVFQIFPCIGVLHSLRGILLYFPYKSAKFFELPPISRIFDGRYAKAFDSSWFPAWEAPLLFTLAFATLGLNTAIMRKTLGTIGKSIHLVLCWMLILVYLIPTFTNGGSQDQSVWYALLLSSLPFVLLIAGVEALKIYRQRGK